MGCRASQGYAAAESVRGTAVENQDLLATLNGAICHSPDVPPQSSVWKAVDLPEVVLSVEERTPAVILLEDEWRFMYFSVCLGVFYLEILRCCARL